MNRKITTTILSLFIVTVFLMSAYASTSTAATTSEAAQTDITQATEVAFQPVSDANAGPGAPPPGAGTGGSNTDEGLATATGSYTLDGGTATLSSETYTATEQDQSGVYAINGAKLTLSDATIITSGNTSSDENSSFYGLNAGVLAAYDSAIDLSNSSITTSAWNVTADSHITCLADTDGISGTTVSNIIGNGHTVYYGSNTCTELGGQTYILNGGGALQPEN